MHIKNFVFRITAKKKALYPVMMELAYEEIFSAMILRIVQMEKMKKIAVSNNKDFLYSAVNLLTINCILFQGFHYLNKLLNSHSAKWLLTIYCNILIIYIL